MAMDLSEDIESIFDPDELADEATYTAPGESAVSTVVIVESDIEVYEGDGGSVIRDRYKVSFPVDDIDEYTGVPSPERNASIVISSGPNEGTYIVDEKIDDNGFIVHVLAKKQYS